MPYNSKCPSCLQHKKKNRRLCKACIEIYGNDAEEWPDWLRYLVNEDQRWRYDRLIVLEHELPFGDDDNEEDANPDFIEPLWTRDENEMGESTGAYGSLALPYAPYGDDEEMNIEYRKANGIPEILNIDICDIDPDELDTELLTIF